MNKHYFIFWATYSIVVICGGVICAFVSNKVRSYQITKELGELKSSTIITLLMFFPQMTYILISFVLVTYYLWGIGYSVFVFLIPLAVNISAAIMGFKKKNKITKII